MQRTDETALITGAASGMGEATAHRLGDRGAAVALVDVSEKRVEAVADEIRARGGAAIAIAADVSDDEGIRDAVRRAESDLGPLRTVVACAGIEVTGTVTEMDIRDWHAVVATNLTGVFLTARHSIPSVIRGGGGSFVAVSSDGGIRGSSDWAAYCATKHGVVGLVRSMALDHGGDAVRCNVVCPGITKSPMGERILDGMTAAEETYWRSTIPLGCFATPSDVAAAVAHLTSDDALHVSGQIYVLDGGATAGYFQPVRDAN